MEDLDWISWKERQGMSIAFQFYLFHALYILTQNTGLRQQRRT